MMYGKQRDGSYLFTDIVNGQLVKQVYYGFPLNYCKRQFKQYLRELKELK